MELRVAKVASAPTERPGARTPILGVRVARCARAASGHAAAAPPSSVMNSRLLPRNSIRKPFGINGVLVSWIRVRSAHGNSFDHFVSLAKQQRRNGDAECLSGFEVDEKLELCRLLHREFTRLSAFQYLINVSSRPATDRQTVHPIRQKRAWH